MTGSACNWLKGGLEIEQASGAILGSAPHLRLMLLATHTLRWKSLDTPREALCHATCGYSQAPKWSDSDKDAQRHLQKKGPVMTNLLCVVEESD